MLTNLEINPPLGSDYRPDPGLDYPRHSSGSIQGNRGNQCLACHQHTRCLVRDLSQEQVDHLSLHMGQSRTLKTGAHLYLTGDRFRSVHTVLSGTLKGYILDKDGQEQILGFYFPGDIVGLDAIASSRRPASLQALERSTVCEINYSTIEAMCVRMPHLQQRLVAMISAEITSQEQHALLLNKKSAEQKLATFLLELVQRMKTAGFSQSELRLSMSRREIGNYLGLATETVSRLFSRFQELGLLNVECRSVAITGWDQLKGFTAEY